LNSELNALKERHFIPISQHFVGALAEEISHVIGSGSSKHQN